MKGGFNMLSVEKIKDLLKAFFNRKTTALPVALYVDFLNGLDRYTLKIRIPERMKENVEIETRLNYVAIRINDFYKKIYLYEPIDESSVKTWYHEGVYGVEIPKSAVSPEERLNRWALVMGI
jgi:HSP20 family molecular chaperone IbpA